MWNEPGSRPDLAALVALDAPTAAPLMLGLVLETDVGGVRTAGRIVEVEAYTEDDPASHSHRGITPRTRVMFGPPGRLYVYLSYGLHRCANVVVAPDGRGEAVLVRALEPLAGVPEMRERRRGRRDLADGPGKLCEALGIELAHDGVDVVAPGGPVRLLDDGVAPARAPRTGPRVGISKAVDRPWRFRLG
jgi:DNA-3-methyladenine glycosylase